jgi:hypothetical protein
MVVWKTVLKAFGAHAIMVPNNTEMLFAREQHGEICVWYRCDPNAPKAPHWLTVVGTGHPLPENADRYLGTASLDGGSLMFHVFDFRT